MMIKYIAGACIISAGVIVGNSINLIYKDRICVLKRFYDFVMFCENEINFYKTEMCTIIEKFRENSHKFDKIIFEKENTFLIKGENALMIKNFFRQITELDSDSQKYYFSDIKTKTKRLIEEAEKDANVNGKMFKRLTPILALGITVLTL